MRFIHLTICLTMIFLMSACSEVEHTERIYPTVTCTISTNLAHIKEVYSLDPKSIANKKVVSIQFDSIVKKGYSENVRNLELKLIDHPNLISANYGGFQNPAFGDRNEVTAIHSYLFEGSHTEAKKFLEEETFILVWEDDDGKQQLELDDEDFNFIVK